MTEILAGTSTLLYLTAYGLYNRNVLRGTTQPCTITWIIWTALSVLNFLSYQALAQDSWKCLLPACFVICSVLTLGFSLRSQTFRIQLADIVAGSIALAALGLWYITGSATVGNLTLQLALFAGFLPTWIQVRKANHIEPVLPWILWASGYALALVVVLLRVPYSGYSWVLPVNGIWMHALVPILARYKTAH